MQNKKKQIRSRWLRKLMRVHMLVTALSLGVYFLVAFLNPGFLSYDLRQKYHALADDTIAITATVLAPPEQPIVTAVSQCDASVLGVKLDWVDDANTYTYDIVRNAFPLVAGISLSRYSDTTVSPGMTYEYTVTANGPMGPGFAVSDPVSVTTLSTCGTAEVVPTVSISSFNGRSIDSYDGIPRINDRRPEFSGTTNIPYAIVQIRVESPVFFVATVTANANGYWEWRLPEKLSIGTHTFTAIATDPNGILPQVSTSFQFEVKEKDDEDTQDSGDAKKRSLTSGNKTIAQLEELGFADFSLSVKNQDKKIFQGGTLDVILFIKSISPHYQNVSVPVRLSIMDAQGSIIVSSTSEEFLQNGSEIQKQLDTPTYIVPGKYFVQAEVWLGETNVSRSEEFMVAESPLFDLSSGVSVTYAEIVRNIGWVSLALLITLLVWVFMFMREYGMYLHAIRHITEGHLRRAGFMTQRKGVIR